jgi:hypothetical protein
VTKNSLGKSQREGDGLHTNELVRRGQVSLTVSLAASKRSTTSASAAEAEQATLRLGKEDGGQCFRRGHLGHGRSCNRNEGATLGLGMASMDDEGIDEFS